MHSQHRLEHTAAAQKKLGLAQSDLAVTGYAMHPDGDPLSRTYSGTHILTHK